MSKFKAKIIIFKVHHLKKTIKIKMFKVHKLIKKANNLQEKVKMDKAHQVKMESVNREIRKKTITVINT